MMVVVMMLDEARCPGLMKNRKRRGMLGAILKASYCSACVKE
jgi:hypothetical protein